MKGTQLKFIVGLMFGTLVINSCGPKSRYRAGEISNVVRTQKKEDKKDEQREKQQEKQPEKQPEKREDTKTPPPPTTEVAKALAESIEHLAVSRSDDNFYLVLKLKSVPTPLEFEFSKNNIKAETVSEITAALEIKADDKFEIKLSRVSKSEDSITINATLESKKKVAKLGDKKPDAIADFNNKEVDVLLVEAVVNKASGAVKLFSFIVANGSEQLLFASGEKLTFGSNGTASLSSLHHLTSGTSLNTSTSTRMSANATLLQADISGVLSFESGADKIEISLVPVARVEMSTSLGTAECFKELHTLNALACYKSGDKFEIDVNFDAHTKDRDLLLTSADFNKNFSVKSAETVAVIKDLDALLYIVKFADDTGDIEAVINVSDKCCLPRSAMRSLSDVGLQ